MSDQTPPPVDEPPLDDPRPQGLRTVPSLVVVNTGDGKGKSSSAFGVMLRALARDWPVAVVQFLKSGAWSTGEEAMGRRLGVTWFAIGEGFTWDSSDISEDEAKAREAWRAARELIEAGAHRLVILDEVTYPMNWGWIDGAEVVETIRTRPAHVSIVATGRDAPAALVDVADTVTEMRSVKHAYERGIAAKKGIDW
jgi:cob(I)alamin adenosyltransferase